MFSSIGNFCDLRSNKRQLDRSWNSNVEYKSSIIPQKKWIAEIRIPRKSMPEITGKKFVANISRGRILAPECNVKVPYYRWYPGVGSKSAENCGTVILADIPVSKNILLAGDFNAPVKQNRMSVGKKAAWIAAKPIVIDKNNFMTKGQSVRLELPGGNRILRQKIDKNLFQDNRRYQLSFYVKLANVVNRKNPAGGFYMDIRFGSNGSDSVLFPLKPSLKGTLPWTRYQFEFTAPAGTGAKSVPYIGFYLAPDARGKVWIDHVEIKPVETTSK